MREGKILPPLELYKLKPRRQVGAEERAVTEYYVVDGHHRVAMARKLGQDYLDAHVVEHRAAGGRRARRRAGRAARRRRAGRAGRAARRGRRPSGAGARGGGRMALTALFSAPGGAATRRGWRTSCATCRSSAPCRRPTWSPSGGGCARSRRRRARRCARAARPATACGSSRPARWPSASASGRAAWASAWPGRAMSSARWRC